jgi:YD repeat-containing protein
MKWILLIVGLFGAWPARGADRINGFDVSNATVPRAEIRSGGPGRDGIPALLKPKFVTAAAAKFLRDDDIVMGFAHNGEARAYPIRILNYHELVNDIVGGQKILVTYCPLCGTGMVFDRGDRTFGVSGLLYQSDVLMYDHQTESLWSQLETAAIAGKSVGQKLEWLASHQMTWKAWRTKYPATLVLSTETGHRRDYDRDPYAGYERNERTLFPVPTHNKSLPNKERVAGLIVNGQAKAYPLSRLTAELADGALRLRYDKAAQSVTVTDADGHSMPVVIAYWFAWQAFYPDTTIYQPQENP